MFVLMAAVVPPILSDDPPQVPQRAGLGGRFHYFRGLSGRRYLFSSVPTETLADFRSAVVILAEPARDGRLFAHAIATLDASGRVSPGDSWPPAIAPGTVCLVHFLAGTESDRRRLVADLTAFSLPMAA
jgi:hypothetical protein